MTRAGRSDPMEAFEFRLRSDARVLAELRQQLSVWLIGAAVPEQIRFDIILATHEVAANAIEHAQSPFGAGVVNSWRVDEIVIVEVCDSGTWKDTSAENDERGRGLQLVEAAADDLHVSRNARGTTLRFVFQLPNRGPA